MRARRGLCRAPVRHHDRAIRRIVYDEKGLPMGAAPTDCAFVYYGGYQFTLVRDGYETLVVREKTSALCFMNGF